MTCHVIMFIFQGLKGGALLSTLFTYTQHGDPEVKGLVKHLLNQVHVCTCVYTVHVGVIEC